MGKGISIPARVSVALSAIGPGLFLIGYNIGTGSVTTMARSGARYGMTLFWTLVLSCIFTYITMVAYGRLTLITGDTALFNIKNRLPLGKPVALYIMIALIIGELLALMGVMGIVADMLQEGSRLIGGGTGLSTLWITVILVLVLYLLLWYGKYPAFEKMLTIFVILMGVCFILVFVLVKPKLTTILNGLIPRIPDQPGALALIAAMAGTTCSAAVFIIRSTVVAEKGWTRKDLKKEKRDAFVSAATMLLLSGTIMAVAAGTLHIMDLNLTDTVEMVELFQPLGGTLAAFILILGVSAAGISTVFPIILIAPWLICDYSGKARNIRSPLFRILGFIAILFCFGLQFLEERPPAMMIFSQAFQACILPAVVIPVFILLNDKKTIGGKRLASGWNIGLAAVILFALITSSFAIADLLG